MQESTVRTITWDTNKRPKLVRKLWRLSVFVLILGVEAAPASATFEAEKLIPSDVMDRAEFGTSVSVSGNTAIVGAWKDAEQQGSAFVYTFDGISWVETQKLTPGGGQVHFFGYSVAVDGDVAIVGAYADDTIADNAGSAYVFTFDGSHWTESQVLVASDAAARDSFGFSVAIDGNTAIIGAPFNADPASRGSVAYIFKFNGTRWYEMVRLTASEGHFANDFGRSVAIDGNTAIVGAPGDDDNGQDSGSVYVFNYDGTRWLQTQKLTATDGTAGDRFGGSVAVEGRTAIIGAAADDEKGSYAGSAYIFASDSAGWREVQKLTASDAAASSLFGNSVDVDGIAVIVGASYSRITRGSAYVYVREGTIWQERQRLLASNRSRGDQVGDSVTLVGSTAIVGAPGDDNTGERRGAAYIFALDLPIAVMIDIKPFGQFDKPNRVQLPPPMQRVKVQVLSTNTASGESVDFDALQVDPTTVRFGPWGAGPILRYVQVVDKDRDGDKDLLMRFNTYWTGISCTDIEATMTGKTYAGEPFVGKDSVSPYPCP
jgi:hypothetical protein